MKSDAKLHYSVKQHIVSLPDDTPFVPRDTSGTSMVKGRIIHIVNWSRDCLSFEIDQGLLFLLIPFFLTIGVVSYFSLSYEPDGIRLVIYCVLNLGILYLVRYFRPFCYLICALICILLGAVSAKFETWRLDTPMLGSDVSTHLTGRIVSLEMAANGQSRILLDIIKTEKPTLMHAPKRIKLSARKLPAGLIPGDGINGSVRLRSLSGPIRPGGYDFSFFSYFQSIGAQGFFLGEPVKVEIEKSHILYDRIATKIALLRMKMTERITGAIGGETGYIAAALITGQRGGITTATNDALRIAGLAHILSISGLHMAMVSGLVLAIVRGIFSLFPIFSSHHSSKKIAAAVALFVASFYLTLSGADVAAQRSFVMVAVMLVAVLFDRSAITMRNIAIAALITLAVFPHEVLGPSFQMSFSATAALVAVFGWWSKRNNKREGAPHFVGGKIIRVTLIPVVSTAVASLIAGTASGIYASYHFSNTAPFGVLSNALAFPVMSFIVMPFALLAAISMPFHLEDLPLRIMGYGVTLVEKIAHRIADISPDIDPGVIPISALSSFTIGLFFLLILKTKLRYLTTIFFAAGFVFCIFQPRPLLIISEDARLTGVIENNQLYVDKDKPSSFTTNVWRRSYRLTNVLLPSKEDKRNERQFYCNNGICTALTGDGVTVAVIENQQKYDYGQLNCPSADVVIIATDNYNKNCNNASKHVITRKQLALHGSVIMVDDDKFISAIENGPVRPWNEHRKYLRAARN